MGSATPLSRRHKQHIALLAIAFILSRALAFWAGMRYLANEDMWLIQLLDLDILHHHLLRGLFHLHAQPPLLNLLLGLSIKIAGPHYAWLIVTLQLLLDLAADIAVYLTLTTLDVSPALSLATSLLLLLNPSAILYDFDALYTSFVFSIHALIAFSAARYIDTHSRRALVSLTALAVTLTLLRSTYHWLWLACLFAILAWEMVPNRKQILKMGAIGLLLALVWPAKNYVLFRHFSSTTWAPYNLSRMWGGSPLVRARSPLLPTLSPTDLSQFNGWLQQNWSVPPVGYPELDDIARPDTATNWNSLTMLRLHDAQLRDDLYLFRHYPGAYAHHVFLASILYFAPSWQYLTESKMEFWTPSHQLYEHIEPVERPVDRLCCFPLGYRSPSDNVQSPAATMWIHLREVCIGAVLAFAVAVVCLVSIPLWPRLWSTPAFLTVIPSETRNLLPPVLPYTRNPSSASAASASPNPSASATQEPTALDPSQPRKILALLLGFTVLYAFVLSSLLEIGENMRFGYETHALVLLVGAIFVQQIHTHRRLQRRAQIP